MKKLTKRETVEYLMLSPFYFRHNTIRDRLKLVKTQLELG